MREMIIFEILEYPIKADLISTQSYKLNTHNIIVYFPDSYTDWNYSDKFCLGYAGHFKLHFVFILADLWYDWCILVLQVIN